MRPVVEGMGLSWGTQYNKLTSQPERFACLHMKTHDAAGREQVMTCIPLRRYPMWLATINPAKIPNPAVRQRVERMVHQ